MNNTPPRWRLVLSEPASAAWNMACDESLAESVRKNPSSPILRFYQWKPFAVSFGYSQRPRREVDLLALARDGYGYVRRITGGRAVFHAQELTYSLLCSEEHPLAAGGIHAAYARTSEGLVRGLRRLGIGAELARTTDAGAAGATTGTAPPCFGSVARAEVVVRGRKLVGSAQHRSGGVMLQHGSILIGPAHRRIVRYLRANEEEKVVHARILAERTICLRDLGWAGTAEELAKTLATGFADLFGVDWGEENGLTETEELSARDKVVTRYGTEEWNCGPTHGGRR